MIVLNGSYAFETEGLAEIAKLSRAKTFNDSINGYLIKTRSRYVRWRFSYTLSVNKAQLENLLTLFAESVSSLDLIDHRGFSWLIASGTDDSTHAYSTGADFEDEELVPTKANPKDYNSCEQSFRVPINLIVSARGLMGNTANVIEESVNMVNEVPSGTINGINPTFTLSQDPNVLILFKNGQEQKVGVDYTLSGSTITFLVGAIPTTGSSLDSYYTV